MKTWSNVRYFYFADDVHLFCKKPQRSNCNTDIQMAVPAMTDIHLKEPRVPEIYRENLIMWWIPKVPNFSLLRFLKLIIIWCVFELSIYSFYALTPTNMDILNDELHRDCCSTIKPIHAFAHGVQYFVTLLD